MRVRVYEVEIPEENGLEPGTIILISLFILAVLIAGGGILQTIHS